MIFKLDKSLLVSTDKKIFANFISIASKENQKVDCTERIWSYIEQQILNTNYLGKIDIDEIRENVDLRDIKTIYRTHFTEILVGNGDGMINIHVALQILTNESYLILENSRYDWPTIKKWIEIFDGKVGAKYKTVNSIVHNAVKNKKILPDHAGGCGTNIVNRIQTLRNDKYAQIYSFKLSTLYDSDKNSKEDESKHQELEEYLSENHILGHELIKREIENYYSWDAYKEAGFVKGTQSLPPIGEEYDYTDIPTCGLFNLKKSNMETMPRYIKHNRLIRRIQNNMIDCNGEYEIQVIIFMLAKII